MRKGIQKSKLERTAHPESSHGSPWSRLKKRKTCWSRENATCAIVGHKFAMRQERTKSKTGRLRGGREWGHGLIIAWLALSSFLASGLLAADHPAPLDLLRAARFASAEQDITVRGRLRSGAKTALFTLRVDFGRLRFDFVDPARVIEVRLGEDFSGVYDGGGQALGQGMAEQVSPGMDLTVEDLSLGFLYWPDARLIGRERVRTRSSWKMELRPGKFGSEFAVVRVWIDQKSGALLRIEGFDWEGKLSRRFEVVSGQKIDGQWMLKQMRIERFGPESSSRPLVRSYLEILGKEEG